jgi:DNA-binding MarR family transcriptional regulator
MPNDQIAFALARIATLLKSQAWDRAEPLGINPTQGQILARIAARGASGPRDLAADLGVTQPTVSDAVAALVRKGMLARSRDAQDGRAVRLSLTEHGARVAALIKAPSPVLAAALDTLPPGDRDAMQRALAAVIRALQQARASAADVRHLRPFPPPCP